MKKTILKSLLMGVAALTALTASAENKLIIEDFSIAPGELKEIPVYIQNDQVFNSFQFEFAPIEGLSFVYACEPGDAELIEVELDDHWPHRGNGNAITVSPQDNTLSDGSYRVVLTHMVTYSNANKYVVPFGTGEGILCVLGVQASEDFAGGQIVCTYAKGDYSDPAQPDWVGNFEIVNQEVCNVTVPVSGTPLATIVAEGVDNETYTVADNLHIVAKTAGGFFVSDGNDNWMKVVAEGDVAEALQGMDDIKGGTLEGVFSEAAGNQKLTVTKAPTEGSEVVTVTIDSWNLAQDDETADQYIFAPKVNSVIKLTGYWWPSDQMFHGYYSGGQKVYMDFSWCAETPDMPTEIQLYEDVESIVQLRETTAKADLPTDNAEKYTIYPTSITADNVVTGVENVKGSKDVVSVQYVNVAGQVANTPFQGVNMVVTRYADGSTVTTKVIK